ncbi:hypothetical protein [Actinokineospora globicatena]|uniref:Uncharacterized protein n=1 Tax=Actinokineospora globicatena TaxID=103729 RepID=A0A9W6V9E7_9PSEU|nr:hypothetical protein [Actinokineospora globicatena]MCP2306625.1 hypothetical protein [Actinokineospora globicatena]GLW82259.1 hypothetical protein Aglo01_67400 [Actinokineospora globicatena]GLW89051.1 hypothetical protein Aglo02_66900 [Actinokineospora globicatena]GLW95045.1 hypothetical protein Aglo03_58610 [Actinokineospora globicatena]
MSVPVLVTVDDGALGGLTAVVAALESAGLRVDRVLPEIATITGAAEPSAFAALRAVSGVDGVERAGPGFSIPHPGKGVQ